MKRVHLPLVGYRTLRRCSRETTKFGGTPSEAPIAPQPATATGKAPAEPARPSQEPWRDMAAYPRAGLRPNHCRPILTNNAVKASACPLSVHWLEWLAVGIGRKVIGRSQPTTCFYLLETTRTYAAEKLIEPAPVARRHAQYFAAFFERAEADLETGPMPVFLEAYSRRIDDVRSALGWAFSAVGDGAVGGALTVASAPIWVRLSSHKSVLVQLGRRSDR